MNSKKNVHNSEIKYGTYFILPFKDLFKKENRGHLKGRIIYFIKLFSPPVLVYSLKKIMHKLRRA